MNARRPSTSTSSRGGLTLGAMQSASPQHTGTVQKLHVSPLFTILPHLVQKLILTVWCFKFLRPRWQTRYLVLLGSYLYKFSLTGTDDATTTTGSTEHQQQGPKGAPLAVESLDAHLIDSDRDFGIAVHLLPPGYDTMICVSTLRKKYYYACTSRPEAVAWINSLREARHEATTRFMGHAPKDAYPANWAYFDALGRSLANSKDRIRRKMEESREMEMSHLTGGEGGPGPRGYYG